MKAKKSEREKLYDAAIRAFAYSMGEEARHRPKDWKFSQSDDDPKLFTFGSDGLYGRIYIRDLETGALTFRCWNVYKARDEVRTRLLCHRETTVDELLAISRTSQIGKDTRTVRHYLAVERQARQEALRASQQSTLTARTNLVCDMSRCASCGRPIDPDGNSLICPKCEARMRRTAEAQDRAQAEAQRIAKAKLYEHNRAERNRRRAAAKLCTRCGGELPGGYGYKQCPGCRADSARRFHDWYAKHKAKQKRRNPDE